MAIDDDFANQIASLDADQLGALLSELEGRRGYDFAFDDVTQDAPGPKGASDYNPWGVEYQSGGSNTDLRNNLRQTSLVGRAYGAFKSRSDKKKAAKKRRKYEAAVSAEKGRQKDFLEQRIKSVRNQLGTANLRNKVNQQFRDLELEGLFDRMTQQGLDASVLGITQQHEDLTRESGFDTVGRGLGGSSVDADRVADLQSSQDRALAAAAAQASQTRQNLSTGLDQQRRSLLASVSGSNPGEEARLGADLNAIQANARNAAAGAGQSIYGMGIQQEALAGQSQAIGGLLSSYANLYNQGTSTPGSQRY